LRRAHLVLGLIGLLITTPVSAQHAANSQPTGKMTVGLSSLGTAEAWLPWLESGRVRFLD